MHFTYHSSVLLLMDISVVSNFLLLKLKAEVNVVLVHTWSHGVDLLRRDTPKHGTAISHDTSNFY